ncbi:MAG: ATP-binding protein [Bacteroidota bacterium]
MIELKWSVFQEKFFGKEQEAFESLAYELFCQEHNQPFGIHSYQDQTGIETDPIKIGKDYIGFQAKFLEVKPSGRKLKLIKALKSSKNKNSELTKILFYLNQPFSESPLPNLKKSQVQTEIEDEAEKLNIKLYWKVPSQLKIQLSQPENQRIYNRYFTRLNLPTSNEILKKFRSSSFHLRNVTSHFEGLEDSHIPRKETTQLMNWVKKPLGKDEKGVMLLVGNAGYGKSVIIKDLYEGLNHEKIPVLGIKADKYYAKNKKELQERLDFGVPVETLVETLAVTNDYVVILIDQIDALSQSMSAKREYLDAFQLLVNSLASISGVRVIISVRTYDLNYDTDLRYYNNQKSVKVGLLDQLDVQKILTQKEIDQQQISPKLLELIRIPHHLNVLCKVIEGNQTLQGIQTLHDLYNELWYQKITQYSEGSSCREAIYEITSQMYINRSINLSKFKIEEKYFTVIEYLKSNSLLVESRNEIQFFHQTFFDYCFAQHFVESGQSIENYILINHQGLHIRATLKMVISFLRDHDLRLYISTLRRVLKSSKFRYHIKVLLITELGYREHPNELEKDFVHRYILSDNNWKDIFIEAVNTVAWLDFLDLVGELKKLVTGKPINNKLEDFISRIRRIDQNTQEDRSNLVYHLFRKLLPASRHRILQIIHDLPEFTNKPRFVFRLLYFINKWDNPLAMNLFERYAKGEISKDTHGFYKILEDAAKNDLDWTLKIYGRHLKEKNNAKKHFYEKPDLGYDDCELFKNLFALNLEKVFDFTLNFIKATTEGVSQDEDYSRLWSDLPHGFTYSESNHNDYEEVYRLLIDKAKQLSTENPSKYEGFVKNHLNDNSQTILLILAVSLQEQSKEWTSLTLDFLDAYFNKEGFETSDIEYYVRELITNSYQHFTLDQRLKVNELILNIDPKRDKEVNVDREGMKCHYLKWYGKTKYEYLCAIPYDFLFEQPFLKKAYQELKRKFGEFQDQKPSGTIVRAVPSPLPLSAYENMSFKEWENSFLKYEKDGFPDYFGPFRGSRTEHSRAFKKQVTDRPSEFSEFVEKLIDENRVNQDYILSGLTGLKEGEYDPTEFLKLFKKALNLDLDREHTLYLIWLVDHLIDSKNCDDEVINFLCDFAINHEDPSTNEKVEDSIQHGINTVRGAAVSRLPYLLSYPHHSNIIFKTIEKVLEDPSTSVKATLIPNLYYLMNLDKERSLKIFLKVVEFNRPELLKHTPRTVQHLSYHFFKELKPYFLRALDYEEIQGDVAVILAVLWINNVENCYEQLNEFLKKSSDARSRMIDVAIHNLFDDNNITRERSKKLFLKFLNSKDEKVIQEYSTAFLYLKNRSEDTFKKIFPLLLKYSKSNVVKSSPHYYYEYLLSNAKEYPKECIDLISRFRNYDKPDISKSGYYSDDPVKILVGVYNSLRNVKESDKKYKEKSMKIFDQLLKDNRFRYSANNVTDQVES